MAGLLLLAFVGACGVDPRGSVRMPPVTVTDSADVEVVTIHVEAQDLPEWRLGPVLVRIGGASVVGEPELVRVLDATWLGDGRIVVADQVAMSLHLYGPDGTYQRSLGGPGDGPSEFRRLGPISIGRDGALFVNDVSDPGGGSMQVYDPDTGFRESISLPIASSGRSPRRTWLWPSGGYVRLLDQTQAPRRVGSGIQRWPSLAILERVTDAGAVTHALEFEGSYSAVSEIGDVRVSFTHRPVVSVGGSALIYGSGREPELRVVDGSFRLRRIIRWPSLREPLDERALESAKREWRERQTADAGLVAEIEGVTFAPEVLPSFRPALGRVTEDDRGRMWIARFEPYGLAETEWYVLDAGGEPVGRIRFPREEKALLAGIRGDSLLVIRRDALDVSRVEIVQANTEGG